MWKNRSSTFLIDCVFRVMMLSSCVINQKNSNVGAGTCGIRGHMEEVQRFLHETMRLAEARLVRHALGGSMPC